MINNQAGLLRSLSPMLGQLEAGLRAWLDRPHVRPLPIVARATLDGLAADLRRKAADLDREQPFLTIMLMGGTGVGKSTLLNALAGHPIAAAAVTRPTTRDCVVYHHRLLPPDRLDPALRHCRLVTHERDDLLLKVLVDTPDLDSNEIANRHRLEAVLPVADIVLYVGSQEKYHDGLGWALFREQRQRRAFAFVLNKWDRCQRDAGAGTRPDADLLRDLEREGFTHPRLYRTAADRWANGATPTDLPPGEQFADLVAWVEHGLTRLEIEALKARGVGQLVRAVTAGVAEAMPPDLAGVLGATEAAWDQTLAAEAEAFTEALVQTLDPNAAEIEFHFSHEGTRRFTRLMAAYLGVMAQLQQAGVRLRERLPASGVAPASRPLGHSWDLHGFARECIRAASERSLQPRAAALAHRLTVEADACGFPATLLPDELAAAGKADWRGQYESAMTDAFASVREQWSKPTGGRRVVQAVVVAAANVVPELSLLAGVLLLLWRYFVRNESPALFDFVAPFLITLAVLVLLHLVIHWLLPMRWPAIRGLFRQRLAARVRTLMHDQYAPIPARINARLEDERRALDRVRADADEVAAWLAARQQSADVGALYGDATASAARPANSAAADSPPAAAAAVAAADSPAGTTGSPPPAAG